MIGYKICTALGAANGNPAEYLALVALSIPEDAEVVTPVSNYSSGIKMRCSKAKVIDVRQISPGRKGYAVGEETLPYAYSFIHYMSRLLYETGHEVYPDSFDPDPGRECSHGIHFFATKKEALDYAEDIWDERL